MNSELLFCMAQQPLVGRGPLTVETSMITLRHTIIGRAPLDE